MAGSGFLDTAVMLLLLAGLSAAAVWYHWRHGYLLYYGDAQAHLMIARRVIDSRAPGLDQIGTVWLPLPHLLMLPFVGNDRWWHSGLAGAIPSATCFVIGCVFFYAAITRLTASRAVGATAALLVALNPNWLYLQSIPMTEPYFFCALAVLVFALVSYRRSRSLTAILLAGAASNAASLSRYEGWFLIPFVMIYLLIVGGIRRPWHAMLFAAMAALAPLAWLAHNWWHYGNFFEFYDGPYSAKAIYQRALDSGMAPYPGDHDWAKAWQQFRAAARLCAGAGLSILGLCGVVILVWKRLFFAPALLSLPVAFYLWSIYSSGTPIFVPHLWPHSYYNTRYGLAAFPLLALSAAALVLLAPQRWRWVAAAGVLSAASVGWLTDRRPDAWICWKESQVNSEARRAWTAEAAAYFKRHYRMGQGVYTSLGDLAGIFRQAGIPLKELLHEGIHPWWNAAQARPDLFLREQWAVAISGDSIATLLLRAERNGPRYQRVKIITIKGAPVIEIYRRQ